MAYYHLNGTEGFVPWSEVFVPWSQDAGKAGRVLRTGSGYAFDDGHCFRSVPYLPHLPPLAPRSSLLYGSQSPRRKGAIVVGSDEVWDHFFDQLRGGYIPPVSREEHQPSDIFDSSPESSVDALANDLENLCLHCSAGPSAPLNFSTGVHSAPYQTWITEAGLEVCWVDGQGLLGGYDLGPAHLIDPWQLDIHHHDEDEDEDQHASLSHTAAEFEVPPPAWHAQQACGDPSLSQSVAVKNSIRKWSIRPKPSASRSNHVVSLEEFSRYLDPAPANDNRQHWQLPTDHAIMHELRSDARFQHLPDEVFFGWHAPVTTETLPCVINHYDPETGQNALCTEPVTAQRPAIAKHLQDHHFGGDPDWKRGENGKLKVSYLKFKFVSRRWQVQHVARDGLLRTFADAYRMQGLDCGWCGGRISPRGSAQYKHFHQCEKLAEVARLTAPATLKRKFSDSDVAANKRQRLTPGEIPDDA